MTGAAAATERLEGIRGWLLVLAVLLCVSALRLVDRLRRQLDLPLFEDYRELAWLVPLLNAGLFLLLACTLVSMFRRSRCFPAWFRALAAYAILLIPLQLMVESLVISARSGTSFVDTLRQLADEALAAGWLGATAGAVLWLLYVARSRRVANTFVR